MGSGKRSDFCLWLEAEVAAFQIDFRYALNTGHSDSDVADDTAILPRADL